MQIAEGVQHRAQAQKRTQVPRDPRRGTKGESILSRRQVDRVFRSQLDAIIIVPVREIAGRDQQKCRGSDFELVPWLDLRRRDRCPVHIGVVVATEVAHCAAVPGARNLAVPAGDGAFIETNMALRLASHNVSFCGKRKRLSLPRSGNGDELWVHG